MSVRPARWITQVGLYLERTAQTEAGSKRSHQAHNFSCSGILGGLMSRLRSSSLPSLSRASIRLVPINPLPPVIMIFLIYSVLMIFLQVSNNKLAVSEEVTTSEGFC